MGNVAVVTGASSGIGTELAREHASRGGDLVLVARREDKLAALAAELRERHGVGTTVIAKDLAAEGAAEELFAALASTEIDVLMNNAGFGGHGRFHERRWEDDRDMIRLNVLTLAALTRLALPAMVARGRGRVLNVASVVGFMPGPQQAVYYASKAFVLSFSEAIAHELRGTGVTVTALCPGATRTGFFEAADLAGSKLLRSLTLASPEAVAAYGYKAMLAGQVVAVHGGSNKLLAHFLLRLMPRSLVRRISASLLEKD